MSEVNENTTTFPVETIELPSRGRFYPENSPLRSGQIEVYYMTAKHEDILTSPNLIQKGIVLDRFIDAIIATKGVKSSDLLLGDLNAVMVAARILGYGKDYTVSIRCSSCGEKSDHTINLSELDTENEPDASTPSEFTVQLPVSKANVVVRMMTRGDEIKIDKEIKSLKKLSSEVDADTTTRLKSLIKSVNGDDAKSTIWNFVDSMLVKDSKFLRDHYKKLVPDVNFTISTECEACSEVTTGRLPIGADFFWPDARV